MEEAARRYPGDPDVLYHLGEGRVHLPHPMGGTPERALEPFERAITLDPGFGPVYEHAVELAFQTGQPERARKYASRGKSEKAVFAARTRIAIVANWM